METLRDRRSDHRSEREQFGSVALRTGRKGGSPRAAPDTAGRAATALRGRVVHSRRNFFWQHVSASPIRDCGRRDGNIAAERAGAGVSSRPRLNPTESGLRRIRGSRAGAAPVARASVHGGGRRDACGDLPKPPQYMAGWSTTEPDSRERGTSMMRWLREPRKRMVRDFCARTKGPSTSRSSWFRRDLCRGSASSSSYR